MLNNIANKLVVSAKTEAEIESFLFSIIGVDRNEIVHMFIGYIPRKPSMDGIGDIRF